MADNRQGISAGGAFVEMFLDRTRINQEMKTFARQWQVYSATFSKSFRPFAYTAAASSSFFSSLRSGVVQTFTGAALVRSFDALAFGFVRTLRKGLSGDFFSELAAKFRAVGASLALSYRLALTGAIGVVASFSALAGPLRAFANFEQLSGRFAAVFRDAQEEALRFSRILAGDVNTSVETVMDQMATFQGVLLGANFNPQDALALSKLVTEATQDIQAWDDTITDSSQAMEKMLSILAGMVKPAERLGANLRIAGIEEDLLAEGINKTNPELSQQERILTRLNILFEAMGRAGMIGQANREVATLSAVFRGVGANAKSAAIAIGQAIEPLGKTVGQGIILFAKAVADFAQRSPDTVQAVTAMIVGFASLGVVAFAAGVTLLTTSVIIRGAAVALAAAAIPLRLLSAGFAVLTAIPGLLFAVVSAAGAAIGAVRGVVAVFFRLVSVSYSVAVAAASLTGSLIKLGVNATWVVVSGFLSLISLFAQTIQVAGYVAIRLLGLTVSFLRLTAVLANLGLVLVVNSMLKIVKVSGTLLSNFIQLGAYLSKVFVSAVFQAINLLRGLAVIFAINLVNAIKLGIVALIKFTVALTVNVAAALVRAAVFVVSFAVTFGAAMVSVLASVLLFGFVVGGVVHAIRSLWPEIQRLIGRMQALGTAARETFGQVWTAVVSKAVSVFQNFSDDVQSLMLGVQSAIAGQNLRGAVQVFWQFVVAESLTATTVLAGLWEKYISGFVSAVIKAARQLTGVLVRPFAELLTVLDTLELFFLRVFSIASELVGAVHSSFNFGAAVDRSKPAVVTFLKQVLDIVATIQSQIGILFANLEADIGRLGVRLKQISNPFNFASVQDEITKIENERANDLKKALDSYLQTMRQNREFETRAAQLFTDRQSDLNTWLDDMAKGAENFITSITSWFNRQDIGTFAAQALSKFRHTVDELFQNQGDPVQRTSLLKMGAEFVQQMRRRFLGEGSVKTSTRQAEGVFADRALRGLGGSDIAVQQLRALREIKDNTDGLRNPRGAIVLGR